ncbi:PREDICTED: uncharacterized protein LOC109172188 [Ipomoea nil]|uniref:uncharacterized protein LOC109172188 n=1 Tax=Ipomoea nil TaxID=35883 RepID=UPI000900AC06|nr:PREDICTED: uncharacterized protein LOC109172188 [Ipomoea nil]
MKVTAMKDHRNLKSVQTSKIFSDLKAYEFEHEPKVSEEPELRNIALVASQQPSTSSRSKSNPSDFLSDEQFTLFVRKLKRFMRKNNFQDSQASPSSSNRKYPERSDDRSNNFKRREPEEAQMLCYNCRKPRHFKVDCPYPMARKHWDQDQSTRIRIKVDSGSL